MNHMQILKRSWKILWSYRTLWVFGIILALTSGSTFWFGTRGGGSSGRSSGSGSIYQFTPPAELRQGLDQLKQLFSQVIPRETLQALIAVAIVLACVILLLFVLSRIAYYISEAALIRMVQGYESTEEKVNWKQGLRLGWSRATWRLFLIDLAIFLPLILGFIVLFGCAALPVLLGIVAGTAPTVVGGIATVGLAFLLIFLAMVIALILTLILQIIRRVCVLQGSGVVDSIRQGWQIVRNNLRDVFVMWLIVLGIRIGYTIAVIPVVLLLVGVGMVVGVGLGAGLYFVIQALVSVTAGWIAAITAGFLVFLVILCIPLIFLNGLRETYLSSTWTLTYRELSPLVPQEISQPVESGAD